jgi:hypothetical protein
MNCPNCNNKASMARPKAHELKMVCNHCKYQYTDEQAEETLGIKRVPILIDGQMMDSFENIGGTWELFPSPYCLKYFKTYDERVTHDHTYHKIGDEMTTSVPSGFTSIIYDCGNENTLN